MVNSKIVHGFFSDNYGNLTGLCGIFCLHFLPDLRQIWTFEFPQGSAATYLRCGGKWYIRFIGNFALFGKSGKRIFKICWDLTKLPPGVWLHPFWGTRCRRKLDLSQHNKTLTGLCSYWFYATWRILTLLVLYQSRKVAFWIALINNAIEMLQSYHWVRLNN